MSYDSFSDHSKQISGTVFRILSLRVEPQNGVEVVKPVLEELEVMRLSCALGALSSVSIEEFKHDMLEAHEFDVEFARFLRNDVFRSAAGQNARDDSSAHLKVLSLSGKQSEVKKELARLGCWSAECEANMSALDQGIFCAKVSTPESNTHEPVLVLFTWLQDGLFEPQRLRDIVTYVLRFLTCLGPDVVCCLSGADAVKMQEVMSSVASTGTEDWNSYSVALRVEKQEDEKDEVRCEHVQDVHISSNTCAQDRRLIKGAFPAIAALVSSPTATRFQKEKRKFKSTETFAMWVAKQTSSYKVQMNFETIRLEQRLWHPVLVEAGKLPKAALDVIRAQYEEHVSGVDKRSQGRVNAFVSEVRALLIGSAEHMFNADVLMSGPSCNDGLQTLLSRLKDEQETWSQVDEQTQVTLHLPIRLAKHWQYMYGLYTEGFGTDLDAYLMKIVTRSHRELCQEQRQPNFVYR